MQNSLRTRRTEHRKHRDSPVILHDQLVAKTQRTEHINPSQGQLNQTVFLFKLFPQYLMYSLHRYYLAKAKRGCRGSGRAQFCACLCGFRKTASWQCGEMRQRMYICHQKPKVSSHSCQLRSFSHLFSCTQLPSSTL